IAPTVLQQARKPQEVEVTRILSVVLDGEEELSLGVSVIAVEVEIQTGGEMLFGFGRIRDTQTIWPLQTRMIHDRIQQPITVLARQQRANTLNVRLQSRRPASLDGQRLRSHVEGHGVRRSLEDFIGDLLRLLQTRFLVRQTRRLQSQRDQQKELFHVLAMASGIGSRIAPTNLVFGWRGWSLTCLMRLEQHTSQGDAITTALRVEYLMNGQRLAITLDGRVPLAQLLGNAASRVMSFSQPRFHRLGGVFLRGN